MTKNGARSVHAGGVFHENLLAPLGMSANALAKALNEPAPRLNDIVREQRGVSADTATQLARYFGDDASERASAGVGSIRALQRCAVSERSAEPSSMAVRAVLGGAIPSYN
jgi:addiction module HigA family antidote